VDPGSRWMHFAFHHRRVEFVDAMLSKTQRKTPTVCHKGWYIQRLRDFYSRKIQFTADSFTERLTRILTDFPRLDDIHPYYRDLINILYSSHHYKLALGQISTARTLITHIAKDHLRLMHHADSQYRCKCIKRAALGRMAKLIKKLNTSLGYLERVRQHMSRLPSIDPKERTLLITGFPNVGKSSFINKVSKAESEVCDYAFTTKSIFVGHFDYKDYRWQVIDTPGILDHSLEERNTIEMQAINALAHLNATVLFFVDVSESCGYTIKKQAALFREIRPLFANKPVLIVANKVDLRKLEDLDEEDTALIKEMASYKNSEIIPMSNVSEENISRVKATACDLLLRHRHQQAGINKALYAAANNITIAQPVPRDNKPRPSHIPESVMRDREEQKAIREEISAQLREEGYDEEAVVSAVNTHMRQNKKKVRTLFDIEQENGGPGQFVFDLRTLYDLKEEDWRFDTVPEIMDGKNVADFYDEDILEKLDELEREEAELEAAFEESGLHEKLESDELTPEQFALLDRIRLKKATREYETRMRQGRRTGKSQVMHRSKKDVDLEAADEKLTALGLDTSAMRARIERQAYTRPTIEGYDSEEEEEKAQLQLKRAREEIDDEEELEEVERKINISRSISRMRKHPSHARSQSRMRGEAPEEGDGFKNYAEKLHLEKRERADWYTQGLEGRVSNSDRHVYDWKPKHLYSGKRGMGKTDRR